MKTILITLALLLSMAAQGQGHISISYDNWTDSIQVRHHTELKERIVNDISFYKHVVYDLMLRKSYLDYCYADSVVIENYGPEIMMIGDDAVPRFQRVPHEYPTFEGYVKWLEKLLNQ